MRMLIPSGRCVSAEATTLSAISRASHCCAATCSFPESSWLAVSDQGLGIPAAEQRRVFEKFYRLDPGMTRGIGGTGLGLYICRELVRRVGGRIWVESAVGRGSTFYIEMPVADARVPVAEPAKLSA